MTRVRACPVLLVLPLAILLAGVVSPQPAQADEKSGGPGMDEQMMKQMMELAQPGEQHKEMDRMVGDWKTSIRMWMPGPEPTTAEGTAHCEWILGGRYLQTRHLSTMNGMPFEGIGIDGYDRASQHYFSLWMDNMGTGVMHLTGDKSPDGKSILYSGTVFDPALKADTPVREEVRWLDAGSYVFTMFMNMPGSDGKPQETKVMELSARKM